MEEIFKIIDNRKASGECVGWKCVCKSSDNTLPPEFEDIKANE